LAKDVTECVTADAAEETGLAAQSGQADGDIARGSARPGIEVVLLTRYWQQIDERLAGDEDHGVISGLRLSVTSEPPHMSTVSSAHQPPRKVRAATCSVPSRAGPPFIILGACLIAVVGAAAR
jgi:hypothetical protein